MNKKDQKASNKTHSTIDFYAKRKNETYLECFIRSMPQDQDIQKIMQILDGMKTGCASEVPEKTRSEAAELVLFLLDHAWNDPGEIKSALFLDEAAYPEIIKIGMEEIKSRYARQMMELEKIYQDMSWNEKGTIDHLVSFIRSSGNRCYIAVSCTDGSTEQIVFDPAKGDKENDMDRIVRGMIIKVMMLGGGCVIRAEDNDHADIYGIRFEQGHAKALSAKEIRKAYEDHADEGMMIDPHVRYEKLPVVLY